VLLTQGDRGGALRAYHKSLEVIQKLADVYRCNPDYQQDIGGLQEKVGDVLRSQGDLTEVSICS
jgi:hypothetical protein